MKKTSRKTAGKTTDALEAVSFRQFSLAESNGQTWEPPVTAEEHARERERNAADFDARADKETDAHKRQGLLAAAHDKREEAIEWRALLHVNGKAGSKGAWDCADEISDNLAALLARLNAGDKVAAAALTVAAHKLLSGLEALTAKGDKLAAKLMLEIAADATGRFYQSAHRKPALFLPATRRQLQIPSPVGRNKESRDGSKAFIKKMKVGEDAIFKGNRWAMGETSGQGKYSRRAFRLAAKLIGYIEGVRGLLPVHRLAAEAGHGLQLPAWTADAAKLKLFSRQTWSKWAAVAWTILESVSPEQGRPEQDWFFYARETAICKVRGQRTDHAFGTVTKAASIGRHDIKEALFSAFRSLATGHSK